jgi:hypothetical protein
MCRGAQPKQLKFAQHDLSAKEENVQERIRRYLLCGGIFDGKRAPMFFPGDDLDQPPPLWLQIGLKARISGVRDDDGRTPILSTVTTVWAAYQLAILAGREDQEPIYRYVYVVTGLEKDPEAFHLDQSSVEGE